MWNSLPHQLQPFLSSDKFGGKERGKSVTDKERQNERDEWTQASLSTPMSEYLLWITLCVCVRACVCVNSEWDSPLLTAVEMKHLCHFSHYSSIATTHYKLHYCYICRYWFPALSSQQTHLWISPHLSKSKQAHAREKQLLLDFPQREVGSP